MDNIRRIQEWYLSYCDGEWEHDYGVEIGTLDNPGWWIDIDLVGTKNEKIRFDKLLIERTDDDWVDARVEDNIFKVMCGPLNLDEALAIFLSWAKKK